MESNWGIGAMIRILGGNEASVAAYTASLNKKIVDIKLDKELNSGDGALLLTFKDGSKLLLYDCARSCCESRYMSTDDNLEEFKNSTLKEIVIKDGGVRDDDEGYGILETQFMHVKTTKGTFVINTYNHHNGYYGGIIIEAELL